jgi:hypothetical protein
VCPVFFIAELQVLRIDIEHLNATAFPLAGTLNAVTGLYYEYDVMRGKVFTLKT